MDYQGKIVWITGASSGIGEALAKHYAAAGAKLILSGRREDALYALADNLDTDCYILPFDTTDFDALPALAERAIGWQEQVDVLVNNAGISQRSLAVDTAPIVYHKIINVDLLAPILLTQAVLPHMVARKSGMIIGISSVAGRAGVPLRTAYCAAKHGLIGYLDALRAETEVLHGLKVHTVLPGSVQTQVSANALGADGKKHGKTNSAIANGIPVDECATRILQGVADNVPEILVADGMEENLAKMRHDNPEQLFTMLANMAAQMAKEFVG